MFQRVQQRFEDYLLRRRIKNFERLLVKAQKSLDSIQPDTWTLTGVQVEYDSKPKDGHTTAILDFMRRAPGLVKELLESIRVPEDAWGSELSSTKAAAIEQREIHTAYIEAAALGIEDDRTGGSDEN